LYFPNPPNIVAAQFQGVCQASHNGATFGCCPTPRRTVVNKSLTLAGSGMCPSIETSGSPKKSKAVAFGVWLKALDQCDALGGSPSPYINAYHIYFLPLLVE